MNLTTTTIEINLETAYNILIEMGRGARVCCEPTYSSSWKAYISRQEFHNGQPVFEPVSRRIIDYLNDNGYIDAYPFDIFKVNYTYFFLTDSGKEVIKEPFNDLRDLPA